jgi:hypothetical protein
MDKLSETISIRVSPEEKERVELLAKKLERKVSDTLHKLIFADHFHQDLLGGFCPQNKRDRRTA